MTAGGVWLSRRTGAWWHVRSVSRGSVLLEGPRGCVRTSLSRWPGAVMTLPGFRAWVRKHAAVLLPDAAAAEVLRGG